uniref:Uncharacterized protein n=1 Tax=Arundo donax TaxID=35708 RepID=A0A0A9APN3_ARUDO
MYQVVLYYISDAISLFKKNT